MPCAYRNAQISGIVDHWSLRLRADMRSERGEPLHFPWPIRGGLMHKPALIHLWLFVVGGIHLLFECLLILVSEGIRDLTPIHQPCWTSPDPRNPFR